MNSSGPARVLVVDDEPELLDVLAETLAADGHVVTAVGDGVAALDHLAAEPFDILVTDLVMPGLSGLDVAESVKRTRPGTPVILVTAFGDTARRARIGPSPIDFMLTKPLDLDELRTLVSAAREVVKPPADDRPLPVAGPLVLVVERDPAELCRVASLLEGAGCRVDTAPDGRRALALACARPYDLVLMDCGRLDSDGFAAATALRRSGGVSAGAPVVALSGSAGPDARTRCLAAGMDDFVAGPLTPASVVDTVRRWGRTAPVLDAAVLGRLRDLDDEGGLVDGMIERFLRQASDGVAALRRAAESGDTATLASRAAALSGEARTMGAFAMLDLCRELEALGRGESVIGTLRIVERLHWELSRVRWVLQRRVLSEVAGGTAGRAN